MVVHNRSPRVDYDQIAHQYDGQGFREKQVDPHLLAFLRERLESVKIFSGLDIGCGTGNQLVANRPYLTGARLVGLDLFHGMLCQGRAKADNIFWVQADGAFPPFSQSSFDFISNQFSFHHVQDKEAMIRAVYRMLRPNGRFVMVNICPRKMPGWLYYQYFPTAFETDLVDFLPIEALEDMMCQAGFVDIMIELSHVKQEQTLSEFLQAARHRDHCSQLMTISDDDYQVGLRRVEVSLNQAEGESQMVASEMCFLTMVAEKT